MSEDLLISPYSRTALALGGGGARGLAHIGVLQVLEREGVIPGFVAASGMGGVVGALHASGLSSQDLVELARHFHFPRRILPGGVLHWEQIFQSADLALSESFEALPIPLALVATDIEAGTQVVLRAGALLPAVRATCAIPGVLRPEQIDNRWLVDGAVVNALPVDVAWTADHDIVIAVDVGGPQAWRMPKLRENAPGFLARLGRFVPTPAKAKVSLELAVRAAEILLDRQTALCAAMTDPEVLVEPELGDLGVRDFDHADAAIAAGRLAMEDALPVLQALLAFPPRRGAPVRDTPVRHFDPVCAVAIHPMQARAAADHRGIRHYFCSESCRNRFLHSPARYLHPARPVSSPRGMPCAPNPYALPE